jgi:hypothetical protein
MVMIQPSGLHDTWGAEAYSYSQQFAELVGGQLPAPEDSVEQAGADELTRVNRHNLAPANLVTQKVMAAFHA